MAEGTAGLDEPSRAPARSPNRKIFAAEEALILTLRREKGLGLHRLRDELRDRHALEVSADTILKVLRRAGEAPLARGRSAAGPSGGPGAAMVPAGMLVQPSASGVTHEGVAGAITDLITSGDLRPGEKLSEARLGARLGVGRTLVREALKRLAATGLVTSLRHRGAFVARPSMEEVEQAYAARRLVEGAIIADVARHCTAHDIRALRHHVAQQAEARKAGQRARLVRLLTDFHLAVASLGENKVLEGILVDLAAKTSLAVLVYDNEAQPECGIDEHARIVDFLAAGDAAQATLLMQHHLMTNQGRLLGSRDSGSQPSSDEIPSPLPAMGMP